ncbi:hypothetical protein [Algoriphagus namhaensis]
MDSKLWTSDHSILTSHFIISKEIGQAESRNKISRLINFLEIQPTQKARFQEALGSQVKELEDGVQLFCASSIPGID